MRTLVVGLFLSVVGTLVACGEADPYGDMPDQPEINGTSAKSCKAGASEDLPGADPSTLPKCKGEKASGRCVETKSLGPFASQFETATCSASQACVPDEVVKQGSKLELKKCTAVLGGEGRCFWPLAKDIVGNYDLLKSATKDQCDADQVCAPCVNPLNKQDTGLCSLGAAAASCTATAGTTAAGAGGTCPQVEPIVDTTTFAVDTCGSNMLCVEEALVGDQAKNLKPCSKGRCAPKKSVERGGNYVPKTCRSTNDAEGRCANVGIPQIGEQKDILPQAGCDADERCAPCFDPRDGSDSGACHQASCDAPKEPAKQFASCCGGRARCVPTAAVDASAAGMLAADTCSGGTPLCAPVELIPLPNVPVKKCASLLGLLSGICVSKCAISVFGASLVQGDCNDDEMCAPCALLPDGTANCQ